MDLLEGGESYTDYLNRTYGIPGRQQARAATPDTDDATSLATTSVATRDQQRAAPPRLPSRPLTGAERLSRNRAARRAITDTTMLTHLSNMYHMHRRIYESYAKSGLLQQEGGTPAARGGGGGAGSRPSTAPARPGTASARMGTARSAPQPPRSAAARMHSMPARSAGLAAGAAGAAEAAAVAAVDTIAAHRPMAAPQARQPQQQQEAEVPSYTRRHVSNTRAALKAAILDEIVAQRVYEGARLRALFRQYLKLNAGESFFPTLQAVVEELRVELGVE